MNRTNPATGSSDAKSFFFGFGGARLALLGLTGLDLQQTVQLQSTHTVTASAINVAIYQLTPRQRTK